MAQEFENVFVYLLFHNNIDGDGGSNFVSVHGSLAESREAVPVRVRHLRQENPQMVRDNVEDYIHYTIRRKIIAIPVPQF